MMKLFFGLMDKINRPLHIIDLSFSPLRRRRHKTGAVDGRRNNDVVCFQKERTIPQREGVL